MRRVHFFRQALLCILLVTGLQGTVAAQPEASFDRQKMDKYLRVLDGAQKFMGTVDIDSAGQDIYGHSVGFIRTRGDTVMADSQTVYRIGSITKTFTATMIMQLIEEGKLSLSTKLRDFYPDIPQADRITIEHLLRHQSGIRNLSASTLPRKWLTKPPTKQQKLDLFRSLEPTFSPGVKTEYSNTNFALLGFIIEDVTGESYGTQLQKRIAEPLGLRRTRYGERPDAGQNVAASFRFEQSRWKKQAGIDLSIPGGAGGVVSTPDELTDFIHGLFDGKLVSEASLKKMKDLQDGMGMGLYELEASDAFALGHRGGIDGFRSHLAYFPDQEVAVAYSANGLNYSRNDIFAGVTRIYFGREFELPDFD
jgi:D-alanyl-D-alanine carboxypeptidase